ARELDLRTEEGTPLWHYDEMDYSHQPDATRLKRVLASLLRLKESGDIVPGDILLLNIEGNPQHLAIVSRMKQGLGIIHAYAPAKAVVEHRLDAYWKERINAVFTL